MAEDQASHAEITLPKVKAPIFSDIEVEVVAPALPDGSALISRLQRRLHEVSLKKEREPGEQVALEDDVEVDIITIADGAVVSDGVRRSFRFWLQHPEFLPELVDELVGMQVGAANTFELVLPADYAVDSLQGKVITAYVEIKRAWQVEPFELEDKAVLLSASLGNSVEEALAKMAEEIDAEQGEQLLILATQAVLNALGERVTEPIDESIVDAELRAIWEKGPGELLNQPGFDPELAAASLQSFVSDTVLRREAELRLKINLAIGAVIEEQKLEPSKEIMSMLMQMAAEEADLSFTQVRESLASSQVYAVEAASSALYLTAVEFVMARAKVNVIEPEPIAAGV